MDDEHIWPNVAHDEVNLSLTQISASGVVTRWGLEYSPITSWLWKNSLLRPYWVLSRLP